ncbi:MAG: VRR-NUC domain-containing protein [Acutalibacter sp.]|nr:VRR-NUC domain-containing protein [Acutalibacter sp.]
MPKESYFQSAVLHWLKETYPAAFVWKVQTAQYARQGVPDICAVIDGRFYGFEVKRPYLGKLTGIQQATIDAIRKAGGRAGVVTWPEDAERIIAG